MKASKAIFLNFTNPEYNDCFITIFHHLLFQETSSNLTSGYLKKRHRVPALSRTAEELGFCPPLVTIEEDIFLLCHLKIYIPKIRGEG